MYTRKSLALAAALLTGAVTTGIPATGWAQVEEMIVSVRKRDEDLQKVPLSIVAFDPEELDKQMVWNTADLAASTPGLSLEQQGGGAFATPVIRGMAQNVIGTDLSYDNNVGVFINGIYQSGRNSFDMELIGVDRVEVARGPQSALYGRSTFAGAINYVFAEPTEEFKGFVNATAGSDSDYGASFDVGGPLGSNKFRGRLSAGYREFEGTFGNLAGGDNLQGYESFTAAGVLVWEPVERLSFAVNALYSDRTHFQDAQFTVDLNCGTSMFGAPTYYCGNLDGVGDVDLSPEGFADTEVTQVSLKIEYEFDTMVFTSVTAATESEWDALQDRDYGSLALGTGLSLDACSVLGGCFTFPPTVIRTDTGIQSYANSGTKTDDFSQEFRLASAGESRFSWMAGVFFYDSETSTNLNASLENRQLGPLESYTGFFAPPFLVDDAVTQANPFNWFTADTKAWAVFGQFGIAFSEQWKLTLEGRYTDEEKETHITYNLFPTDETYKRSFDYTSPRITLEWLPSDAMMFYGTIAKGVRTGGINGQVTSIPGDQDGERFFEPEENITYEIGGKTTWLDDRLLFNAAIYYIDWDDTQLPALNSDFFGTHIVNVSGGVENLGFEFETIWQATDWLDLTLGYAYSDPEFKNGTFDGSVTSSCGVDGSICTAGIDPQGRPSIDVSGNRLGRVPQHQANFGINLDGKFGSGDLGWYARSNVLYQSENYARSINALTYGERTLVNLRLAVLTDSWEIAFWGKNLLDEEYLAAQALQPAFDGVRRIDTYQGDGARYGVTGTFRF